MTRFPRFTAQSLTLLAATILAVAVLPIFEARAADTISAAPLTLVEDGQPKAVIVLGDMLRPNDAAVTALVSHVKQMSGATLPVVAAKELEGVKIDSGRLVAPEGKAAASAFIFVGESELSKRMGFSLDGIGGGRIVVKTSSNALALMGRRQEGASSRDNPNANAVFNFLETLGCRCLWPGEVGKVVPVKRTIATAALDVRYTPPVGQRNIRFIPLATRGVPEGLALLDVKAEDRAAAFEAALRTESEGSWAAWNGLGGNIGIVGGAAGAGLRGGWEEHGKAHPEWFALQPDGTRDQSLAKERWRLCVSNPGLVEHVAKDISQRLNGKAQAAISLCPNDGGYSSFCMCDECKKLDAPNGPKIKLLMFAKVGGSDRSELEYVSLTDRYVHYWNAVAERVTKVVPDQLFLIEAYSYYSDPPVRERLHPNLVVRYVPSTVDGWKGWQAAGAKRAYWRPNNMGSGYRYGAVNPKAREVADAMDYLGQNGVLATDMDSIFHNWATQGLMYYVAARTSWDPTQKFDAILDDYCRTGFGAGAEAIKKYFLRAEKGVVPVVVAGRGQFPEIAPETISELRGLLVEAAKATEKDAASYRRVQFLRAGFEFTAISAEAHRLSRVAPSVPPDTKAAAEVMERRWQMMRAMMKNQPLAVNVAVVAGHDSPLNGALKWKGPGELARTGKFQLKPGDDWLNEDQSATRQGTGAK